jgi:uncharacterized glyoxalase superfamily protein PhnB
MAEQTPMPPLTPSIIVSDVKATLNWFSKLGFTNEGQMDMPDGSIVHAEVAYGPGVRLMMGPAGEWGQPGGGGMSLYITLNESVDAFHDKAKAAGIQIADGLADQFWGDRTFTAQHPDGYKLMFAQHVRDVSWEEMKESMGQMAPA